MSTHEDSKFSDNTIQEKTIIQTSLIIKLQIMLIHEDSNFSHNPIQGKTIREVHRQGSDAVFLIQTGKFKTVTIIHCYLTQSARMGRTMNNR